MKPFCNEVSSSHELNSTPRRVAMNTQTVRDNPAERNTEGLN